MAAWRWFYGRGFFFLTHRATQPSLPSGSPTPRGSPSATTQPNPAGLGPPDPRPPPRGCRLVAPWCGGALGSVAFLFFLGGVGREGALRNLGWSGNKAVWVVLGFFLVPCPPRGGLLKGCDPCVCARLLCGTRHARPHSDPNKMEGGGEIACSPPEAPHGKLGGASGGGFNSL